MAKKIRQDAERRQYIRLDSVFPVSFKLLDSKDNASLSDILQGFTSDIGKGGICLCVNCLKPGLGERLINKTVKLSLEIQVPLSANPAKAWAKVAWVKQDQDNPGRYLIGLSYEQIDPFENRRIFRYAKAKNIFPKITIAIILLLGLFLAISGYANLKLTKDNRMLVNKLAVATQELNQANEKLTSVQKQRQELQSDILGLEVQIQDAKEKRAVIENAMQAGQEEGAREANQLNAIIDQLSQKRASLENELSLVKKEEAAISTQVVQLSQERVFLEKANIDKMYKWLKVHQNPRSGLVMSFEGDNDVAGWAFIYDQALVAQAFSYFGEFERAKKIFEFFQKKAERSAGLFYNAYYVKDGSSAEYTVHSGPNIWLGIAIVQYTKKSSDKTFIGLAEDIAKKIISYQDKDPTGGIRGGPKADWYATEHNLDGYAFFDMLYKLTSHKIYKERRDKVLNWLIQHTYDKGDVPIKRGKGDSTIATDTYAWSIAAIGPAKLEEIGMSPDKIIDFAEESCSVEVDFLRPEKNTVKVKGFDFAPQRHLARGGVVSPEWTSQMIVTYNIAADYYDKKGDKQKADTYREKADNYLQELSKMIISSPSPSGQGESCLPYASLNQVDTGHGWMTPKGSSTGSVAGTAYTIFAYYKYNPLMLKE